MDNVPPKMDKSDHIRVLHFVSTLSCGSGVMSVIMNYYRHIDKNRVQFDFLYFVSSTNTYAEEIKKMGGKIYYIDKMGRSFQSIAQLNMFFKKHAREYVWLHNHEVYLTFLLRPISKRYGLENFIVHCHATKYSDKFLNALRNHVLCIPIRFMKVRRFACSEIAGTFLYGKRMMKAESVFIMHNVIDYKKFYFQADVRKQYRKEIGLDGKFVIGHIGRFERQKNHKFVIELFAKLKEQIPESILVLVGNGSLKQSIQESVQKHNLESSILFLGQRDDISALLQMMDVFILPSRYEGLGIVLLEAQAAGLKCFVSNHVPEEASLGNIVYLPLKNVNVNWCNIMLKEYQKGKASKSNYQLRTTASNMAINKMIETGKTLEQQAEKLQNYYINKR